MWLYPEVLTKPFLTSLPAWSQLRLWVVSAWLSCSKAGTWQCLLFVLQLSGFESPKGWPDAINPVLIFCKAGRVSQVTFPHTPARVQALGLGQLGLYQAAPGLLSQELPPSAPLCLHYVVERGKTRGSCEVGPSWVSQVCRHRVTVSHQEKTKLSLCHLARGPRGYWL